jgi:hypothetical protein
MEPNVTECRTFESVDVARRPESENRYDLFEFLPGRFPEWIDSASDLPEATKKMQDLPKRASGGQYLVRDFYSGMVVAYTDPHGVAIFPPKSTQGGTRSSRKISASP